MNIILGYTKKLCIFEPLVTQNIIQVYPRNEYLPTIIDFLIMYLIRVQYKYKVYFCFLHPKIWPLCTVIVYSLYTLFCICHLFTLFCIYHFVNFNYIYFYYINNIYLLYILFGILYFMYMLFCNVLLNFFSGRLVDQCVIL